MKAHHVAGIALVAALAGGGYYGYHRHKPAQPTVPPSPSPTPPVVASVDWGHPTKTSGCQVNGSLQDAACTPGDIILSETKDVICAASFTTKTVRDSVTTPSQKQQVYAMYNIPHPQHNTGPTQVCEIDHLVSLELGGNDSMANLWPQCSPGYAGWTGASFHDKDGFENYLQCQVCEGKMDLAEAQRQIATDWNKYWVEAGRPHNTHPCKVN